MLIFVPEKKKPLKKDVLPFNISVYIDFTGEYLKHLHDQDYDQTVAFCNQLRRLKYVEEAFVDRRCGVKACLETQDFAAAYRRTLQLRKKILRALQRYSK